MKWLDEHMKNDIHLSSSNNWQYDNKMNWSVSYWQNVARRVLLSEIYPRLKEAGNTTLALQLANYASNRILQISPLYEAYHYGWNDENDRESYTVVLPFDSYRKEWSGRNYFDYCSQFFEEITSVSADEAERYAENIENPVSSLDQFLNERGYVDSDYIDDIVGTLYLREMKYDKASQWLAKVSEDYQSRTNLAKEGYFRLDPFQYQFEKMHYISDSKDFKLKYAQEMCRLQELMNSDAEPNRKAKAEIRYAIGLRNSFGRCWYLTQYGYILGYHYGRWYPSNNRIGFEDNSFAQQAYDVADQLMNEAIAHFTDAEQAAQAQLEMMNFATVMKNYPNSKAALYVKTRCDNYYDYGFQ